MKRRDFLKRGGAAAAAAAVPSIVSGAPTVEGSGSQPEESESGSRPQSVHTCARCGSTRGRPVPMQIRTDGSDERRLYGERSLFVTTVEACTDCRDVGVRVL